MTQMLLVRHGQSEWNAQGRWQGQADPPLTDEGRRQAGAAATRVGTVDLVVCSDLRRAVATATIIAETVGVGPVVVEERLRERHAGSWQGLTRAEIERGWPGHLARGDRPADFEAEDPFRARVHAGLHALHERYDGAEVLVVSHGGVIHLLERDRALPHERVPNLGGRVVTHRGGDLHLGERVALVEPAPAARVAALSTPEEA